jgi:hypothetical protein
MASGAFVEEMMREQSLLQATCGDDLLDDFSREESAADVLLLDAPPPPVSPLSARIIDAAQGFKHAAGHVASVSLPSLPCSVSYLPPGAACCRVGRSKHHHLITPFFFLLFSLKKPFK